MSDWLECFADLEAADRASKALAIAADMASCEVTYAAEYKDGVFRIERVVWLDDQRVRGIVINAERGRDFDWTYPKRLFTSLEQAIEAAAVLADWLQAPVPVWLMNGDGISPIGLRLTVT